VNLPTDPYEIIARDQERQRRARELRDEENRRANEFQEAWINVITEPDCDRYLKLGQLLRERRLGLWLDWQEVCMVRNRYVLERGLRPGWELMPMSHGLLIIAIRLLKSAFAGDADAVQSEMDQARSQSVMLDVCIVTHELHEYVDVWPTSNPPPATPFMSRTELSTALCRRLKGAGLGTRPGVSRAIDQGRLQVHDESLPDSDGRTRYARFRYRDPDIHREMLRLAVEHLKNSRNLTFFSGPRWTAESE